VVVHRIGYTLWPASFELSEPGVFLDEAEHLGVDTVEIPFFAARLMANGQVLAPVVRRFEAQMRGRNLEYSTHASMSINLMDVPEALSLHEKIARTSIEITARLGARNMVVHCGTCDSGDPPALEDSYARQRESLARLGDIASATFEYTSVCSSSVGAVVRLRNRYSVLKSPIPSDFSASVVLISSGASRLNAILKRFP